MVFNAQTNQALLVTLNSTFFTEKTLQADLRRTDFEYIHLTYCCLVKNQFFSILLPWLKETYNPCISKTMNFEHIVLIPILLYFERLFKGFS